MVGRGARINRDTHGIAPIGKKGHQLVAAETQQKSGIANLDFGGEKPVPFSLIFRGGKHVNA
jgi:hypothetical protein